MLVGTIFDLRRFSIHDGPGIRTTVFFKGCPLRCTWCHNPESQAAGRDRIYHASRCIACGACVAACPQDALALIGGRVSCKRELCQACGSCAQVCVAEAAQIMGQTMAVAEVLAQIQRDQPFYEQSGGGVTFSGGEPLLQPGFLQALLEGSQALGIHTTVDTSGYAPWQAFDRLRGSVDLFMYDLKFMDDQKHRYYTGVSNERILSNLRQLADGGHAIWIRLPVIPGINDDEDNLSAIGRCAAALPGVERLNLLPYHRSAVDKYARMGRDFSLAELEAPTPERMQALAAFFEAGPLKNSPVCVQVGG